MGPYLRKVWQFSLRHVAPRRSGQYLLWAYLINFPLGLPLATIERSALVNYSAQSMYELVNDVPVAIFMEGCYGAEVLDQTDTTMLAKLQ